MKTARELRREKYALTARTLSAAARARLAADIRRFYASVDALAAKLQPRALPDFLREADFDFVSILEA